MLGKLVKHEFRATARIMLPVIGAMLALAVLANLSVRGLAGSFSEMSVLRVLFILIISAFAIAVVATAVMSLVIMISRFYRNLLRDEGYLMFTLPVNVHELIWSKLIVSLVWFLVTSLVIVLVMTLMTLNLSETNLQMILAEFPSWPEVRHHLEVLGIRSQVTTLMLQTVLLMIIGTIGTCLHFYAAMALGHMFSKSKILLSIVFYVVISFVFSLMATVDGLAGLQFSNPAFYEGLESVPEWLHIVSVSFRHGVVMCVIQSAVLYVATLLGLKKGLNLE